MTALPPPGWRPCPRPGRPDHHSRRSLLRPLGEVELIPAYPPVQTIASFIVFYSAYTAPVEKCAADNLFSQGPGPGQLFKALEIEKHESSANRIRDMKLQRPPFKLAGRRRFTTRQKGAF